MRIDGRRLVVSIVAAIILTMQVSAQSRELKLLGKWITGSFDTFAQVDADEEAETLYRHMRALLRVVPLELPEAGSGLAFYVENQAAETRSKPYRQRVYVFEDDNGAIRLRLFKIDDPTPFVNAHKRPLALRGLRFSMLAEEKGCAMTFRRDGRKFVGRSVDAKQCRSGIRGADYVLSQSEIFEDRIINLDQGFSADGEHKWGPPPGVIGHIFVKRK